MHKARRPTFIARSMASLEDFLDSDFSFSACHVHCQFADDMLDGGALSKMSRRGVERVNFLGGQYFVRQESGWVDRNGVTVRRDFASLSRRILWRR